MNFVTQISGKYSKEDGGVFSLKKHLENAGIKVNFPENTEIVSYLNDIPLTFHPTATRTFYDVEIELFESIKKSNFHIVYNKNLDKIGYIGYSTSHEICQAIKEQKTIVFLFDKLQFSKEVPTSLQNIIKKCWDKFTFQGIDKLNKNELFEFFNKIPKTCNYQLSVTEISEIEKWISELLESYKSIK